MQDQATFRFLDFTARVSHSTRDSRVYDVGKWSQILKLDSGESFDTGRASGVFSVHGRMHVHYPCSGHIKAVISIELPKDDYEAAEQRTKAVSEILRGLSIPEDDTYEIYFREAALTVSIQNRTNREGYSDGI